MTFFRVVSLFKRFKWIGLLHFFVQVIFQDSRFKIQEFCITTHPLGCQIISQDGFDIFMLFFDIEMVLKIWSIQGSTLNRGEQDPDSLYGYRRFSRARL